MIIKILFSIPAIVAALMFLWLILSDVREDTRIEMIFSFDCFELHQNILF